MMLKLIFCEENQKNNNAENFESENISLEAIINKLETIWEYGKTYKCFNIFSSLDLLIIEFYYLLTKQKKKCLIFPIIVKKYIIFFIMK